MNGTMTTTGSVTGCGYWQDGVWIHPSYSDKLNWSGYVYTEPLPVEPNHCIGRAHVFECDHAKACKCGTVKRSNPKKLA